MLKLLAAPDPIPALAAMQEAGAPSQLFGEAQGTNHLARLVAIEGSVGDGDPIRRLGALIADAEAAHDVAARWRLAGADAARLTALTTLEFALVPDLDGHAQRRLIYRLGPERFRDLVLLAWATETKDENEAAWRTMLETAETWEAPPFPVTGADVLARGIPEGPEVGDLLRTVEDWWIKRLRARPRGIARPARHPGRRASQRVTPAPWRHDRDASIRSYPAPSSSWPDLFRPSMQPLTHRRSSPTRCPEQVRA